jgi:hypothetical protein
MMMMKTKMKLMKSMIVDSVMKMTNSLEKAAKKRRLRMVYEEKGLIWPEVLARRRRRYLFGQR